MESNRELEAIVSKSAKNFAVGFVLRLPFEVFRFFKQKNLDGLSQALKDCANSGLALSLFSGVYKVVTLVLGKNEFSIVVGSGLTGLTLLLFPQAVWSEILLYLVKYNTDAAVHLAHKKI